MHHLAVTITDAKLQPFRKTKDNKYFKTTLKTCKHLLYKLPVLPDILPIWSGDSLDVLARSLDTISKALKDLSKEENSPNLFSIVSISNLEREIAKSSSSIINGICEYKILMLGCPDVYFPISLYCKLNLCSYLFRQYTFVIVDKNPKICQDGNAICSIYGLKYIKFLCANINYINKVEFANFDTTIMNICGTAPDWLILKVLTLFDSNKQVFLLLLCYVTVTYIR